MHPHVGAPAGEKITDDATVQRNAAIEGSEVVISWLLGTSRRRIRQDTGSREDVQRTVLDRLRALIEAGSPAADGNRLTFVRR